jgi:hypothetical protein
MPLDVLGRTRATLTSSKSLSLKKFSKQVKFFQFPWPEGLGNLMKSSRAGDRSLQL